MVFTAFLTIIITLHVFCIIVRKQKKMTTISLTWTIITILQSPEKLCFLILCAKDNLFTLYINLHTQDKKINKNI